MWKKLFLNKLCLFSGKPDCFYYFKVLGLFICDRTRMKGQPFSLMYRKTLNAGDAKVNNHQLGHYP